MNKLKKVFKSKKSLLVGFITFFVYLFVYMMSIGDLFIGQSVKGFSTQFLKNASSIMLKSRGPFIWEPIGVIRIPIGLVFNVSPLNILLGLLITSLVTLNIMLFVYTLSLPKVCRIKKNYTGFFGMILGFFTGFLCCVPTFLIPFVISIRQFIVPFILLILTFSAITTIRRLPDVTNM
jgi:hypothetical protein